MTNSESATKPLRVGVLFCSDVQLLDASSVDLLGMITPQYLKACQLPDALVSLGRPVEIVYFSDSVKTISDVPAFAEMSANAGLRLTHTIDNVGALDILLLPGPDPSTYRENKPEVTAFIRGHVEAGRVLLSVCTGIMPVTFSGVLSGKRATAPLPLIPIFQQRFPDVEWTDKRWEFSEDGKIWTSGGVTNGNDMVAAYLRANFAPQLAEIVCAVADVGDRGREYSTQAKEFVAKFSQ